MNRFLCTSSRYFLVAAAVLTFGFHARAAEISGMRKLPSESFKRYMVDGTDFKDALSACNYARKGTGWKAVGFDPPNSGGGVNCKYKKGGSSGEQVGAQLVLRCPDNAAPWISDGTNDVNKQICACTDGFIRDGLKCKPRPERPAEKICDDATYDRLFDAYNLSCKYSDGMTCSEKKLDSKYDEMTCNEAKVRLEKQRTCIADRKEYQKICFASIDDRHKKVIGDHELGAAACEKAVLKKCGNSSSK